MNRFWCKFIGILVSGLRGKGMKRSTLDGQKVKGQEHARPKGVIKIHFGEISQELQRNLTKSGRHILQQCITSTWTQKAKDQGHMRPKGELDAMAEASFSTTCGSSSFSSCIYYQETRKPAQVLTLATSVCQVRNENHYLIHYANTHVSIATSQLLSQSSNVITVVASTVLNYFFIRGVLLP